MDAFIITVMILLVIGALLLVLYPLWRQTRPEAIFQVNQTGQTLEEYQARYQALLASIKDLMFDHEMGKVSTADYEALLTKTKLEAAQVRHQIDRLSSDPASGLLDDRLEAEIEALVAQFRQDKTAPETLRQEVEAEIELLKTMQSDSFEADACAHCGKTAQPDDVFCSGCGQSLAQQPPAKPEPSAEICPECGYAFKPGDTFCARCGASLGENLTVLSLEEAQV